MILKVHAQHGETEREYVLKSDGHRFEFQLCYLTVIGQVVKLKLRVLIYKNERNNTYHTGFLY